jgi:hypothetical protein
MSIYPNPAAEMLYVQLANVYNTQLTVTDINGRVMLKQTVTGTETQVRLANIAAGMYFVTVENESGVYRQSFVKK